MTSPRDEQHVKLVIAGIESTSRLLGLEQPTYGGTPVLTKDKAEAVLVLAKAMLALRDPYAADKIILQEPGVQCRGWCLTLEETDIEFWPGWFAEEARSALKGAGVFAEPVTHCHLGLYPA